MDSDSKQTRPKVNSSFDDLVEAGQAAKCAKAGPDGKGNYDKVKSEESDLDNDMDDTEEPAPLPPSPAPHPRGRKFSGFKRVQIFPDDDPESITKLSVEEEHRLKPLSKRKVVPVSPIRIPHSNFLKSDPIETGSEPPSPSASSSSLTTKLRDKISARVSIPDMFKNKRPREYKLQAFVAILFLTIILLVGSIYVIHKEKELQKSYFDRIRFSGKDRKIRVTDVKGREVLTGILGISLTRNDKPWPCHEADRRVNQTCLEWIDKARLYFSFVTPPASSSGASIENFQCYGILWQSLSPTFPLVDCFDSGDSRGGHFYGGGEMANNQWPLNRTRVPLSPFLTGNKVSNLDENGTWTGRFQWGRTLGRYFVNSNGAAIQITESTPLHVSINVPKEKTLCIGAKSDGYPKSNTFPHLNYTICTAENIREITSNLADKLIWKNSDDEDGLKTYSLVQSPIWRVLPHIFQHGNLSEDALLKYTDKVAALHLSEGFILLDETWQKHVGDLEMDPDKFPTMGETINIVKRRGFKVALTIQPFFSTKSLNYDEGLKLGEGIWTGESKNEISDVQSETDTVKIPALTKYKNSTSMVMIDVTNPEARLWLQEKVTKLVNKYSIDGLYVDLGTAHDLPHHYEFTQKLTSSDYYKQLFLLALKPVPKVNTIAVSSAVKRPKLPTFVALSPTESSWEGLQSIIPNLLTLGTAGYPFLIPGAIGGDYFADGNSELSGNATKPRIPDRELYIRWMELVHFLPVMQYSFLPSDYDQKVVNIATEMNLLRKQKLIKYIKKTIDDAITSGLPIIRPLWMIDSTDSNCLKVFDEFSIGGDIIVAPVLRPGATEREIYLPQGRWRDEMDGSSSRGGRWLHHYRVKENQIAFFTKISDSGSPV